MTNKNIVLYDRIAKGHHPMYMLVYARALLELGNKVTVMFPDSKIFDPLKRSYPELLSIEHDFPDFRARLCGIKLPFFISIFWLWKSIRDHALKITRPDLVYFLCLEECLSPKISARLIDAVFKIKWAGLCITPERLKVGNDLAGVSKMLSSRYCQFISFLDGDNPHVRGIGSGSGKRVLISPDVTDKDQRVNEALANLVRQSARDRIVIGLLGNLSERKGVNEFLSVAKMADNKKFFFLMAGELLRIPQNEKIVMAIERFQREHGQNFLLMSDRIKDEMDFNTLVKSCDVMFAVYKNFNQSSNILTKSALFKKPIIVRAGHVMSRNVDKYNLGISVSEGNAQEILTAIQELAKEKDVPEGSRARDFEGYFRLHSFDRLKLMWSEIDV